MKTIRNNIKHNFILVGVICMGLLSFFGCKKINQLNNQENLSQNDKLGVGESVSNGQVVSFYFHYNGTIGANDYTYDVKKNEDGKYILTYESMEYRDYGEMTTELDENFITGLNNLYSDNSLYKWNGYHGVNRECLDGWGFSLSIKTSDGKYMSAGGSNKTPKGYGEFAQQMKDLFGPMTEKLKKEQRMKIIAEGISGKCDFVMANFKQKGNSGSDSYSMLISKKGVRTKNFDVQIKSDSGEIFPVGEKRYYCEVDNEIINFNKLTSLIKKYKIINWYNFEQSDPDYNNKEWFQVNFGFDEKFINAHGTKHPENYNEFRRELLMWLKEITDKVPSNQ